LKGINVGNLGAIFNIVHVAISDKCTRHRISRLLSKVNVNNMATSRKELSNDCFSVLIKTARNFTKI
jgi:hypothetical protein